MITNMGESKDFLGIWIASLGLADLVVLLMLVMWTRLVLKEKPWMWQGG